MALIESDDELNGSLEAFEEPQNNAPEPVEQPKQDTFEVPEKYRGKNLEDIVKMHQEAEKLIGKQAQEVGEVRKLADELMYCFQLFNNNNFSYIKCIFTSKNRVHVSPYF